jgi:hypothetical protein
MLGIAFACIYSSIACRKIYPILSATVFFTKEEKTQGKWEGVASQKAPT